MTQMSECQNCGSDRVVSISGKCTDSVSVNIETNKGSASVDGYVPDDLGVGGGDYLEFDYCLECGQIQGDFPISGTELEETIEESDEDDGFILDEGDDDEDE